MKIGLTFGKRMLMGYLLVLSMMVVIGMMAYCAMNALSCKAEFADAANRCVNLFGKVEQCAHRWTMAADREDQSVELASNDWKKAKDKFLAEVKKLSQVDSLGEREKQIIEAITESWREYEVSFRRYILAMSAEDADPNDSAVHELKSVLTASADAIVDKGEKLTSLARASIDRVHGQMEIWLTMAIVSAVGLGLMVMLVNIHVWNRAIERAMNRLGRKSSATSVMPGNISAEELESQAQQIRQAMSELMDLLGEGNTQCDKKDNVKTGKEKV
ncbi:MAG: hypothetical protein GX629_01390 [Phycisphaerae bacterium]|nr:hypothetical protein [Phycisphaerae bacterium]